MESCVSCWSWCIAAEAPPAALNASISAPNSPVSFAYATNKETEKETPLASVTSGPTNWNSRKNAASSLLFKLQRALSRAHPRRREPQRGRADASSRDGAHCGTTFKVGPLKERALAHAPMQKVAACSLKTCSFGEASSTTRRSLWSDSLKRD